MIAAIVVLFEPNTKEIEHIKDYYAKVDKVIVMDNSSKSFLPALLSIVGTNLIYKHFPENIGLSAALNQGMQIAKNNHCSWALVMDSDSSFITDIVDVYCRLLTTIESNVVVLSPVHIHDRSSLEPYTGCKIVKWAMTSGCLFNVDIFLKMGGFMEELFVDGLDIDFCYRTRENNYLIMECGEAVLRHYPANTKEIKLLNRIVFKIGVSSPLRYYMQIRSLRWIILRYRTPRDCVALLWKWIKVLFFFENKT